ncbi:hypothetical protein JTE90_029494 [Oedothorax gibbosus]|uniref:Uncharacterized protein n=1 Tax=Oedothorax gibbosus TaxID=931172 RepID=A0AAV6V355_9ARAC|nr:hypothetical protein JTE90_029494 [Oedothorax gibbosus]
MLVKKNDDEPLEELTSQVWWGKNQIKKKFLAAGVAAGSERSDRPRPFYLSATSTSDLPCQKAERRSQVREASVGRHCWTHAHGVVTNLALKAFLKDVLRICSGERKFACAG